MGVQAGDLELLLPLRSAAWIEDKLAKDTVLFWNSLLAKIIPVHTLINSYSSLQEAAFSTTRKSKMRVGG